MVKPFFIKWIHTIKITDNITHVCTGCYSAPVSLYGACTDPVSLYGACIDPVSLYGACTDPVSLYGACIY